MMHLSAILLFAFLAFIWILQGFRALRGMSRLPRLASSEPRRAAAVPRISILFAARDEAEKLPAALASLLAQEYSNYEVVAVDDRSHDETARILDDFARRDPRLIVVQVRDLPPGWLGKPHALQQAYEQSTGEWLLFTDADVHFAPDVLGRAEALMENRGLDHLSLLGRLDLSGFWETVATIYFFVGFMLNTEPWDVSNPNSQRYLGAGYFQMLRRSTYEAIDTHRRLAMEVVDDMKLAKLVKFGGFRSGVAIADDLVHLQWNRGLGGMVRGLTKNFFASTGFSIFWALFAVAGTLLISVVPFLGLVFAGGWARILAAFACATSVMYEAEGARRSGVSVLYGLTQPLGALIFCYILLRSMVVTLRHGGIVWRGTFYPLAALRKGMV